MTSVSSHRITLSRVAEEAGVSKTLVSALFSGKTYSQGDRAGIGINLATRTRVLETARRLRYAPADPRMQLEMYPETGHYCFLVSQPSMTGFESYYAKMFTGAAVMMAQHQSRLNLTLAQFDPFIDYLAFPDELPHVVRQGMTNKYMIVGEPNYSLIMSLLERGFQAIYLSRILHAKGIASVAPDYVQAGYLAMRHLLDLGHRHIAVVGEHYFRTMDFHVSSFHRGLERAMNEFGLSYPRERIVLSRQPDQQLPTTVLEDVLKEFASERPTALFCLCDWTALRVVKEAARLGIRIPAELSIIGCNDQLNGREYVPSISTIHFPLREMGAHAVQWFASWTAGQPPEPTRTLLPVQLVPRESTRAI